MKNTNKSLNSNALNSSGIIELNSKENTIRKSETLVLIDPEIVIQNLQNKPTGSNHLIDFEEIKKKYTSDTVLQEEGPILQKEEFMEELYLSMLKKHPHKFENGYVKSLSLCTQTGCIGCCKNCEKSKLDSLGIGMMLYFKLLKSLILCFFITTIVSMPLYFIYFSNHSEKQINSYMDALFKTTIGNIGSTTYNCETFDLSNTLNSPSIRLKFNCGQTVVMSVMAFGSGGTNDNEKKNRQNCFPAMSLNSLKLDTQCDLTDGLEALVNPTCLNMNQCDVVIDMTTLKSNCTAKNGMDTLYLSYSCYESTVNVGNSLMVTRNLFGFIVAILDLICIFSILITLVCIQSNKKKDFQEYIETKAYIRDFTLNLKKLSIPKKELSNEIGLLMKHFNSLLSSEEAKEFKILDFEPNKTLKIYSDFIEQITAYYDPKDYLVYEMLYPKLTSEKLDNIKKCNEIRKKIRKIESGNPQLCSDTNENLVINPAKIKNENPKIEKLKVQLEHFKAQANREGNIEEVKEFYLTFRNYSIAKYLEIAYNKTICTRCCMIMWCQKRKIEKFYYKEKWLNLTFAKDEPSNIKWENITFSPCKRCLRKTLSVTMAVIIILITLAIILVSKYFETSLSNDFNTSVDCNFFKDTLEAEVEAEYKDITKTKKEKVLTYCFCYNKMSLFGAITNDIKSYAFPNDPTLQPCNDFVTSYLIYTSLNIALIVAIPIVNIIVIMIFRCMTSFERNKTQSKDMASNMWKIFVLRFINTGLLLLIVNISIEPLTAKIPNFPFFAGNFTDFDPGWYNKVGVVILFSMILDIITPHAVSVLEVIWNGIFRCCDGGCSGGKQTKSLTKEDYYEIYTGPVFLIDARYASILSTFFVTMIFSSGIPLLYLCFFVYIALIYVFDKILILKFYRNPPKYDIGIITGFLITAFIATMIHFLFGIWIYGNPYLLVDGSPNLLNGIKQFIDHILKTDSEFGQMLVGRLTLGHNIILLIAFLLLIVILIIIMTIGCLQSCSKKRIKLNKNSSIEIGLAVPLKDLYRNYIIKELEYAQLLKYEETEAIKTQKDNLMKGIEYDKAFLIYKLEKLTDMKYPQLRTNFNEEVINLKSNFGIELKGMLHGDISYNMAFIPEFEAAAYYEYLKNL